MAAGRTAILAIRIVSDATKAAREMNGLSGATKKQSKAWSTATKASKVTLTALGAVGYAAYKQASELQQSTGSVEAAFGKQSKAVLRYSKNSADRLGLARAEYRQTAAVFGSQLKNMGVSAAQLAPRTDNLIKLGADLSATFGGTTQEAVESLSALLRGERDPIEKYGVSIKQADINARLAAKGQSQLTGEQRKAAELQATMDLLFKQTAGAQGQFAREANTAAGQEARRSAAMKDTAASLGTILLPAMQAFNKAAASAAKFTEDHTRTVQILTGVVAALAAGVLAVNGAYKVYKATALAITAVERAKNSAFVASLATKRASIAQNILWNRLLIQQKVATIATTAATKAAAAGQWLLNAAMSANPVMLVVLAVVALVAIMVVAYKRSETFRKIVDAAMRGARIAVGWVVDRLQALAQWVGPKIAAAVRAVSPIVRAIFTGYGKYVQTVVRVAMTLATWIGTRIGAAVRSGYSVAKSYLRAYTSPIRTVISWVKSLRDWITSIRWPEPPGWLKKAGSWAGNLFGSYRGPGATGGAASAVRPATFAAPGELKAAGPSFVTAAMGGDRAGSVVQIVIQGALDPVAVANQVDTLLRRRGLRVGTVTR